jgi:HK97 family phage portal protein
MPESFSERIKHAFTTGAFSNGVFGWNPIKRAGQKTPTRIEPEIFSQAQGFTFDRFGLTKGVGGKFSEISDGGQFNIDRPSGGATIDPARQMESFKGLVYAAVNAVAREVMTIDFRLFEVDGKNHNELPTHDILDLLDTVNDFLTSAELKYYLSSHMLLAGNSYWFLDGVKNATDKPTAIHPIVPSTIHPILDKHTWPYKLTGYKMKLENGTKPINFEPYQILQFRNPNPLNFFEGKSPVEAAAEYIDNHTYLWDYNRIFFINGARPSGFLETDALAETQLESIRAGFANMHQGIGNMQRIAILPKGVKFSPAGTSPKDMDFKNLSDETKELILMMFGVSKTILGTAESDTNRATAETADYVFSKRVVKPHMDLILAFLNRFLVSRYGDNIYLSYLDPVPEDRAARTTEMQAMVGSAPILTPNEARDEYAGLGPVDGGDSLYVPTAMSAAGEPVQPGDVDPEAAKTPTTPAKDFHQRRSIKTANGERVGFRPSRAKFKTYAQKSQAIGEDLAVKIKEVIQDRIAHPTIKFKSENPDALWQHFAIRVQASEKEIIKALQDLNAKQREEVLANLPSAIEKAVTPSKLFDLAAWTGLTAAALLPILTSLYASEGKQAAAEVGKPDLDPMSDASALHQLTTASNLAAESYTTTTQELLQAKLNDGLSQGFSLDQLTQTVKEVYDFTDTARAQRVAKTESFRTANQALKDTWVKSGNVQTLKWYTANNPCDFCLQMQGKVVSINDNFLNKGDVLTATVTNQDGTTATRTMNIDYDDVEFPPLHPQCMCKVAPESITL